MKGVYNSGEWAPDEVLKDELHVEIDSKDPWGTHHGSAWVEIAFSGS